MKSLPPRMVIYTKDVMNITGRKERTAQKMLSRIRKVYGKEDWELVTVKELSDYLGLNIEDVQPFLNNRNEL